MSKAKAAFNGVSNGVFNGVFNGVLAATLTSASGLALAQESYEAPAEHRAIMQMGRPFYVSPMVNYTFADKARNVDDAVGGTLAIGTRLFEFLAIEAQAGYAQHDNQRTDGTADILSYGANLLFFPLKTTLANFYFSLGVQYLDVSDQNVGENTGGFNGTTATRVDYEGVSFEPGLGLMQPFSLFGLPAAARLQAVYRIDGHEDLDQTYGTEFREDVVLSAGLAVSLFAPAAAAPEPAPVAEAPAEVVAVPDSDGDGVPDDLDRCPDTPAGTAVDSSGCPLPVAEPAKACDAPKAGEAMDISGCASGDVIVLHGVTFEFDQARLTPNARVILDGVADALKAAPQIRVEVGGHTDSRGSDSYNLRLSQARAEAVVQYLVGKEIDAARLSSAGYGESKPVSDNATDEGRELNRRVELKVQG